MVMKLTKVATPYFLGGRYFIGYLTVFPYLGNGSTGTFWPCHASATVLSLPRGGRGRGRGNGRGYMPGQNPPGSGTSSGSGSGSGSGSSWRRYLLGGKRAARRPRVARNELGAFVGRGEAKSSRTVPIAGCGRHRLHSSAFAFAVAFTKEQLLFVSARLHAVAAVLWDPT